MAYQFSRAHCLALGAVLVAGACSIDRDFGPTIEDNEGDGGFGGNLGDGDGDSGGGPGGDGDGDMGGAGTGGNAALDCTEGAVGDALIGDNTSGGPDTFELSCAGGAAPDFAYAWTAPYSDYFSFDTAGSDFDTAVAVFAGDCEGEEVACSGSVGASPYGRAVLKAEQGQTYVVVVSGNSGDSGPFELYVSEVSCPSADVSGQPLPAPFTTVAGPDQHTPPCENQGITPQPEKSIRFTAEESGLYRFSASSADFRPVVTLYEGVICGGEYLACNAGQVGLTAYPAEVTRYIEAGDSVTAIVEGENAEGTFDFNVQKMPDVADGCSSIPELGTGDSGDVTESSNHELSSSCSWAGNADGAFEEALYQFTVDFSSGVEFCQVGVELTGNALAYLVEGNDCSGAEVECFDVDHTWSFGESENGDYTLVIENQDPFGGSISYTVTSNCD